MFIKFWLLVDCIVVTRELKNFDKLRKQKIKFWKIYIWLYSSGNKFIIFCFALLLLQILDNYQNQGQFWNLLVLTISRHPLYVQFDQVLAEIFEVKDTRYHSFIFLRFSLIEMKVTDIWTFWSKNCSDHHKRHHYQQE